MANSHPLIVRNSDKQFRLRIDSTLRSLGVIQIICNSDFMDIEFSGEFVVTIHYPDNIEELREVIEAELVLQTRLSKIGIDKI
jgi:hypothetical protein